MAITSIWKIDSRLDQVINYISNNEKTSIELNRKLHNTLDYTTDDLSEEQEYLVTGINCLSKTAYKEMMITKKQYNKEDGIQAFHIIQSFAENEVSPKLAHQIGVELANELFGDRFEVIVATHLNTNHYHNHILINSVSFADGKRYYDCHANYALIRKTSDYLCEEYNLSTIKSEKVKKINYNEIYVKKYINSDYYKNAKEDIDRAIRQAKSFQDFIDLMKRMKYEVYFRSGKISVRRSPYKRNIRIFRAFGDNYSIDNIQKRIYTEHEPRVPFIEEYSTRKVNYRGTKFKNKKKVTGIKRLFLHYCYILKVFPKRNTKAYLSLEMRKDISKMEVLSEETRLLCSNNIETTEQLFSYEKKLARELVIAQGKKEDILTKMRQKKLIEPEKAYDEVTKLSIKIKELRKKEGMCDDIKKRIPEIKQNIIETIDKNADDKKKKKSERGL